MSYMDILSRMESSSCEEIPSSQNPRRSSPAENSNDRTITSKLNNGYCADENDNEALRSQVTEPEEDSTRRLDSSGNRLTIPASVLFREPELGLIRHLIQTEIRHLTSQGHAALHPVKL
ncbi:hypothetical protein P5673_026278 [Acropora cervicornis]|uniref:Uncharacterized protein n=1 Tax=Acropora cervicornis TaxID=6130 RepID=A0AAD9UWK4_ACRCE|nr:hypothetical protein P5673_026278 [Acropora cervicornis]